MASSKPVATSRSSRTPRGSGQDVDGEISPARWAGVALVIAALLGAMVLAVFSPSVPGPTEGAPAVLNGATPAPDASGLLDDRLPTVAPQITGPTTGTRTDELRIELDVAIAGEPLPRKELTLEVLRGDVPVGHKDSPKRNGNDVVTDVLLVEGTNELAVALRGPGGLGPRSAPIEVILDRSLPDLEVTAPVNRSKTLEDKVKVVGTSEVGAKVIVSNKAADYDSNLTIGPDGTFSFVVPLAMGRNEIVAASQNPNGRPQTTTIVVTRKDGKPTIKITAPKKLDGRSLPKSIKVVVDVKDANGDRMVGAPVGFSLQGVGRPADTLTISTNENGRAVWQVDVAPGSDDPVEIAVTVTSPTNQTRTAKHQIVIG